MKIKSIAIILVLATFFFGSCNTGGMEQKKQIDELIESAKMHEINNIDSTYIIANILFEKLNKLHYPKAEAYAYLLAGKYYSAVCQKKEAIKNLSKAEHLFGIIGYEQGQISALSEIVNCIDVSDVATDKKYFFNKNILSKESKFIDSLYQMQLYYALYIHGAEINKDFPLDTLESYIETLKQKQPNIKQGSYEQILIVKCLASYYSANGKQPEIGKLQKDILAYKKILECENELLSSDFYFAEKEKYARTQKKAELNTLFISFAFIVFLISIILFQRHRKKKKQ